MENKENQLSIIVKDSGLEESKAKIILEKFQDAFELADEWTKKAKTIVVTSGDQVNEIELAREGRLCLKNKRIAIENTRKRLKEDALREGKAIDGIANVLKALFDPIEKYLYTQEFYVKIKKEEEAKKLLEEAEKKAEEERIAKEKADAEELERLRVERVEKEKELAIERAETERKAKEEKAKTDAIIAEQKRKADAERAEQEAILAEEREKAKKKQDALNAKMKAEREEKERLEAELKSQITCPHCGKKFKLK